MINQKAKLYSKLYLSMCLIMGFFLTIFYLMNKLYFQSMTMENIKYMFLITLFINLFFFITVIYFTKKLISENLHLIENKIQLVLTNQETHSSQTIPSNASLLALSYYDSLTGLPNRILFNEIANKAISQAKRQNTLLIIIMIEFDDFNNVLANYPQPFVDQLLKEVSKRFQSTLRSGDTLARISRYEFIVSLNDIIHPKFASPVAEKFLSLASQSLLIEQTEISVTASIGISVFPDDGETLPDLETHAEIAMGKAKRLGGNLYQYYRHEMDIAARQHLKLEHELKNAIGNQELLLYYQPQLSLKEGKIKAVEALIRWNHPTLGLISPDKFIHLAEETDLIKSIGEWVLNEACQTNKAWQNAGYDPIIVAVNISPKQFLNQTLAQTIDQILKKHKLNSQYLEIEITESIVMQDIQNIVQKLNEIHELGVRISIDDFGTGYASINYLKNFPVTALKIDQTFIKGIPDNPNDTAITSSIIALGHNLGLDIVAEGVETADQIQYLASQNCDLIQGYFLSRPLPAHKIILQFSKRGISKEPIFKY